MELKTTRIQGLLIAGAESTAIIALMLFLPFVVHLIPSWDDSPLGSHLLPIFYAPLGAVIMGKFGVALVACLAAPWINLMLFGMPSIDRAFVLSIQLAAFIIILEQLLKRGLKGFLLGPVGYLSCLLFASIIGSFVQLAGVRFPVSLQNFWLLTERAILGILILAFLSEWFSRQNHRPVS